MPHLHQDPDAIITNIERWQERQRLVGSIVESTSAKDAVNMSRLARMFPSMSPGVVRSLAQSGVGPDDDAFRFAVTSEFLRNYSTKGSYSGQIGVLNRDFTPTKTQDTPKRKRTPTLRPMMGMEDTMGGQPVNMGLEYERVKKLLKQGETLGVFNPDTQVLVEPENMVDEDGDVTEEGKVFSSLQNGIYLLSHQPVPYLSLDGQVRGFTPDSGTTGARVLNLSTGQYFDHDILPEPTIVGAYRNESGVGGSLGQVEDYGAAQQQESTSAIIAQIFADAEGDTLDHYNTIKQNQQNPATSGISASGLSGVGPEKFVRPTLMALDAPVQEIQGIARNIYGEVHGEDVDWLESQSDFGVSVGRFLSGQGFGGAGSGFFVDPESAVAKERRAREAERGQIGGHNVTIGRILASTVTEPDTVPFQIMSGLFDAGVQLADPSAYALGSAANISDARKTFQVADGVEEAGAFRGLRNFFHGPTAEAFLNKNTDLVNWLDETTDAYEIAKRTNFKLPPALTDNLAKAKGGHNIRGIITGAIERGRIREVPQITGTRTQRARYQWSEMAKSLNPKYEPRHLRFTKMMPNQVMDLDDQQQVATNLLRALHNAHATEDDLRDVYNMVAAAKTRNGLRNAVIETLDRQNGLLEYYGIADQDVRSFLTRYARSTYNEDLRGLIDEVGADVPTWDTMTVNGKHVQIPGPHLPLEHISQFMHIPDQRTIRRLTTKFNFLTARGTDIPVLTPLKTKMGGQTLRNTAQIGDARLPIAMADFIMSEFLKPGWLMRLAWPIRVIGEEQLRISATGLDSAFKHPISYVATVIGGENNRMTRMLNGLTPGIKGKMQVTPAGAYFAEVEEMTKSTYRAHAGWLEQPGVVRTNIPTVYNKNNVHELADWRSSWAHELALLHHDPVSNFVANHSLEESIEWLYRGPGNKFRRELMEAHPGNLESQAQVREYVQTVVSRISRMTADHPDLIDMVKTGKFSKFANDQEVIGDIFLDAPRVNPQFTQHLKGYEDIGPDKIKGAATAATGQRPEFTRQWDAALDRMFSTLMGVPTSTLSRSPTFRQFVWRRATELLPYADDSARKVILANAKRAGLNRRQMRDLEKAAVRGKRTTVDGVTTYTGKMNADDVDALARAYALDDTKQLLYDLSERSQITDIMRLLVPFGEAWKEVLTRWAKLATIEGPFGIPLPGKAVRRGAQVIEGARGTEFGDVMGTAPDPITGKDRGFFYKNEFGEEVYTYPGSEWLTSALTGVPVPLTGRVQGLNMFGNILPGLGPVAQIPVAWYLQDKPQHEWWREQLIPFGAPGATETEDIFNLREYLPTYLKSAVDWLAQGGDDRIYNSSVMYVASYLYSTGEYGDTPDEQQRLLEDAKDGAHDLYAIRGFGQFILPASPSFNWVTQDESGRLLATRILAEEFYELQQDDYDTAIEKFIDRYGPYSVGAIVPHSRNVISAVPTSVEGATWVAKHKSIKTRFPLTYGYFAPEGEFHMPTYVRSYLSGEREAISPREWLNLRDTMMGNYHYQRAKEKLGADAESPNEDQARWLRTIRENILDMYPNWRNEVGLEGRPDDDQLIRELYEVSKNRTVRKTDAGKALVEYLGYRDKAMKQAEGAGFVDFRSANAMAPTRQWLANQAQRLIERYPDFERLWVTVLGREMDDDYTLENEAA